ncbi:TerB family tellurite resistance protein [Saccharicrinis sp. FJH54]|uniref:TerB family tellurite resistance protein n=1 Tax=Saccharicrinis sp. FJH54 TaxID=3344665 RepID=UPI0035D465F4
MGKFSWIGGGLGFILGGGPIGAILGAALGYVVDEMKTGAKTQNYQSYRGSAQQTYQRSATRGDFNISFLVLIAAVMKADGKVLRSELDYVKDNFVRMFGADAAKEAVRMLGDLIKQNIPVRDVCMQITRNIDHPSRLQLLHLLFGVSAADGNVDPKELELLQKIAGYFNISDSDFNSIKSMFVSDIYWPYKVLEIERSSSNEEVKKAYRKMALKFHPDKVSHLSEEVVVQAKEKFQKVSEAYEAIKKERGMN